MTRRDDNPDEPSSLFGMVIDLDRCDGCGACMVACAVENNIPPAPASATPRTGLNWIRPYRVEVGGRVSFIPVMCQQCEHETPCVAVCPQNAVEIDPSTGIVGQIPERCLGCRYCVAACPYHARVFNWWDPQWPEGMEEALNPMVSPRMRGTVEKCNFCHGRWHAARQKAAAAGSREIDMRDYVPACVEACPSGALLFGDLNDPESGVSRAVATGGAFRLLESLDTGSKVYYRTSQETLRRVLEGGLET